MPPPTTTAATAANDHLAAGQPQPHRRRPAATATVATSSGPLPLPREPQSHGSRQPPMLSTNHRAAAADQVAAATVAMKSTPLPPSPSPRASAPFRELRGAATTASLPHTGSALGRGGGRIRLCPPLPSSAVPGKRPPIHRLASTAAYRRARPRRPRPASPAASCAARVTVAATASSPPPAHQLPHRTPSPGVSPASSGQNSADLSGFPPLPALSATTTHRQTPPPPLRHAANCLPAVGIVSGRAWIRMVATVAARLAPRATQVRTGRSPAAAVPAGARLCRRPLRRR
ncbi:vegetative cell wall protein gp1-like [Oryza glaberrima]|uniref:vegetative cell wall protein gp1-like n=1 Tax=Oryza glaberrima TaxID=4538 RepID=UPI00224C0901|nr:vegetative cell wall protein gp1-like [Oryza glaberrima]